MPIRLDELPLMILLGLLKHVDYPSYSDNMFQDHVIFYINIAKSWYFSLSHQSRWHNAQIEPDMMERAVSISYQLFPPFAMH